MAQAQAETRQAMAGVVALGVMRMAERGEGVLATQAHVTAVLGRDRPIAFHP